MTPKQRVAMHRKRERGHVQTARYFLKSKSYVDVLKHVGWALEQASVADAIEGATQRQGKAE
jgi:hypothetical protein